MYIASLLDELYNDIHRVTIVNSHRQELETDTSSDQNPGPWTQQCEMLKPGTGSRPILASSIRSRVLVAPHCHLNIFLLLNRLLIFTKLNRNYLWVVSYFVVKTVRIGCISRSRVRKVGFQNTIFRVFLFAT